MLHDINAETLANVHRVGQAYIEAHALPYSLSATTSREEALQGADFCIISIEVGQRFVLWEQDWKVPLQHGIHQVFGENGGPGGLFHSLRIIPPILEICGDIQRICPDAYVFNYSNPMSRICLAIHRKYPDLRTIGLCHEVSTLPGHLSNILDTPVANLDYKAGGLNHFSVLLEVAYKDTGEDAYPEVREKAPAYFSTLPDFIDTIKEGGDIGDKPLPPSKHKWPERLLFKEVLEKFGYLPITTDSHFGEYIQWAHEVADHKSILDFYLWYKQHSLEKEPHIEEVAGIERVVPIIEGILTDSKHQEDAVNIPNAGLIDNLTEDLVVEVPAMVDKDGVHGIPLGMLPKGFAGLLNNQVAVHDLTAEAALTGSRTAALQALLVDPVVDTVRGAEKTLDAILELQAEYLGYIE